MEEKSKMELIGDFIETCPIIDGQNVNLNYLKEKPKSYSVDETPAETVIQNYTDGGRKMQILFDCSIQVSFSPSENKKNSRICDLFTKWIYEQDKIGNLPRINGICWIKCLGRGTILQTTDATAIYVIPMQVVYEEDF